MVLTFDNRRGDKTGWYSVKAYGATGDGTTDDTAAIQAALTAGAGTVHFPPGTYKVTSRLTYSGRTVIQGAGLDRTILLCAGCDGPSFTAEATDFNNGHAEFRNLTIRGDYTTGKVGLYARYSHHLRLESVAIEQFSSHGLSLSHCFVVELANCFIRDNDGHGIYATDSVTQLSLHGCWVRTNNGWGMYLDGATNARVGSVAVHGGAIDWNGLGGVFGNWVSTPSFIGVLFEANKTPASTPAGRTAPTAPVVGYSLQFGTLSGSNARGLLVLGCGFSNILGSGGTGYHIDCYRVTGAFIAGNEASGCTKFTKQDLGADSGIVVSPGNYIGTVTTGEGVSGTGTFNGTTGTTITHNLANSTYRLAVTPTGNLAGRWYVTKAGNGNSFTVFSTDPADTTQTFDWSFVQQS